MIKGVEVKELNFHKDERGFFSEILRSSEIKQKLAQLSYSKVFSGVAKAWHLHKKQTDWLCVLRGDIKLVLYDNRKNSETYKELNEILIGETYGLKIVKIPPGVAHGYKVLNGPVDIIYITNREYDPEDELRIAHDDSQIGYDWEAGPPIK